ncbi:hypothetical protein [Streptomyces sp. S.PB5]|uniref:hypothetical protein n=1 Tax=Streptomyces sp. S.PB5 TaxID=3020844 RepID=UPI0025B06D30|nr:hypothetical protein [Streptomyces sp. S.PB5]MDN3026433.1 hypothetical protein [Streptomyces sp. S.PB5]
MDAGLAALLGAAVGALGTGGAAAVTGLLGRGQARTQLRAEHVRLLREPRRSAYVAFAQCFQEVHALHSEAARSAASAAVTGTEAEAGTAAGTAGPDRDRLLTLAEEAYARAGERLHGELQSRKSAVTVEGPPALTAAAFEAEGALLVSRGEVYRWIRTLRQGTATADHERAAEDALLAVHHPFVTFLNAASAALADDGLGP